MGLSADVNSTIVATEGLPTLPAHLGGKQFPKEYICTLDRIKPSAGRLSNLRRASRPLRARNVDSHDQAACGAVQTPSLNR